MRKTVLKILILVVSCQLSVVSLFAEEKNPAQAAYQLALERYNHLKRLEETQSWDEYFAKGNEYRDQIVAEAGKAIEATKPEDPLHLRAQLLLWQFHKDQQDAFTEGALSDLMNAALEYAKANGEANLIKEVAQRLSVYGEKGKSKELYKIYVEKIVASDIKDESLREAAVNFYKEGNLELSEIVYDAYLNKISKSIPKEKLVLLLTDIAKQFAYSAVGGSASGGKDQINKDMAYAEKIFQEIEELGEKQAFNQELIYLRAFNLEKAKEYAKAKDMYLALLKDYPLTPYADEALFKTGIIITYILRERQEGRNYFEKLSQKEKEISPGVISSLYQLGLLDQWENNLDQAKVYYEKLVNLAAENFPQTVAKTKERLKEIEQAKPLEYNLKTFLDSSLNAENAALNMSKSELKASRYNLSKNQDVNISSSAYLPASGCTQIELQYLWAGDTGKNSPAATESSFSTAYNEPGTKVINLIIVSSTGIIDRNLDLIDVR